MTDSTSQFSCIILAGGEGKRAHGMDKGLITYNDKPLIEHVIDAVSLQVDDIVISANRNIDSYQQYSNCVISDTSDSYRGPLAGIAASLPHCRHELVLVVACDMPSLPGDLVERLAVDIHDKSVCIATVNDYHQLAMIIKNNLVESIQQRLEDNRLKLIEWVNSVPYKTVNFDDIPSAFLNLNKLTADNDPPR